MKLKSKLVSAIGVLAIVCGIGCDKDPGRPVDRSFPVRVTRVDDPGSTPALADEVASVSSSVRLTKPDADQSVGTHIELSSASAIDIGVRTGTAKPAGPITPEKFTRWKAHEELKVELEIQRRCVAHQKRVLSLVEDREQQCLMNVERELQASGRSIENCLRTFDRLKAKFADRLRLARLKEAELNDGLIAWERQNLNPKPFDPFDGVVAMKKSFNEIISSQQAARLAEYGVEDERDLALTFWLQRERLAQLLGIDVTDASRMVEMAAEHVPREEIESLRKIAERVQKIPPGVLPPDGEEEQP